MDVIYALFVPAILVLGLVTSYTDLKHGQIKNKHIAMAIAYVPVAYAAAIVYYVSSGMFISTSYITDVAVNMAAALAFAFVAWHFNLWSAADGKLFFAYSGLVPLMAYSGSYIPVFPSFIILVNTFFPAFVYYSLKSLLNALRKGGNLPRVWFKPAQIASLLFSTVWTSWIAELIYLFSGVNMGLIGSLVIIIGLTFVIDRLGFRMIFSAAIVMVRLVFDYSSMLSFAFLVKIAIYSSVVIPIFLLIWLMSGTNTKTLSVRELKPGMTLSDFVYKERGLYKKMSENEMREMIRKKAISRSDILQPSGGSGRLEKKNISSLMKLHKSGKLEFKHVDILQTIYFSPFILMGVIITLVSNGSILNILRFVGV